MAKSNVKNKRFSMLQSGKLDITFLSLILILLTIGLVMLFSASYAYSLEYYNSSYKFIVKQSLFAAIGLVLMFVFCADFEFFAFVGVIRRFVFGGSQYMCTACHRRKQQIRQFLRPFPCL